MNRYKFIYLTWLLPAAFLALGLHQTMVYYSIQNTYKNGTSYTAELTDFEFKRIAAQTSSSIAIRFKDKNDSMIKKQMSIPVEMAGDIQKIRVVPIRYEPDNFEEVVLLPAYKTQKSLVWTNMAMAGLALIIGLGIAISAHRYAHRKLKSDPEEDELEFERID